MKERGDHTALIWADIATKEKKHFTYEELAAKGSQCLNAVRKSALDCRQDA
jgi:4-hydroxybutyrate---CoA ligase (AMP-forming)